MARYDGVSNGFLRFDKRKSQYSFTDAGLEQLKNLFQIGMNISEIADFFVVDQEFIEEAISKSGEAHDVFRHASAVFKMHVREAQIFLAPKAPSMAKHLGHQALGQPMDPTPREEGLERRVISAMPDWVADTGAWTEKFKPKQDGGSTIEKLKRMQEQAAEPDKEQGE